MKRIIIIFFVIFGIYLLFNSNLLSLLRFDKSSGDEVSLRGIDVIDIDISSVQATIIPENRKTLKTELSGKGKVTVDKSGDTLRVKYKRSGMNLFSFIKNNPKVTIYLPINYENDMNIKVGSGLLNFTSLAKNSPMQLNYLDVKLGSGKMDLNNIRTEEFSFDGGSGVININRLITEDGSIDINSGIVKVEHYEGKLDASVLSGLLHVQIDKLKDDIDIDVNSGQLKLDLPDDASFKLNSKLGSGLITCDFPLENRSQEKKKLTGVHGSGEHELDISVSSGLVKIY